MAALVVATAAIAAVVGGTAPAAQAIVPTSNSFFLDGEYGDTLVGPQHASFVAPSLGGTAAGVSVVVAEIGHTWTLELLPPAAGALSVGSYTDVMKAGTQTGTHPGLGLAGDSKACTTITGTFLIDQIAFDGSGTVTTLVARWEIHCDGAVAASFGGVSINGSVPYRNRMFSPHSLTFAGQAVGTVSATQSMTITNTGPSSLHVTSATLTDPDAGDFQITDDPCSGTSIAAASTCVITVAFAPTSSLGAVTARLTIVDDAAPGGEDIVLKGTALPAHRGMVIDGETGDIPVGPQHLVFTAPTITGDASGLTVQGNEGGHNYTVDISPPIGQQLTIGTYEAVLIDGSQTANRAGLSVHGDGKRCTTIAGRFVIDDLAIGSNGQVRRLSARWEQHCEQGEPANFGIIDYDGNAPFRDRSIGPRSLAFTARAITTTSPAQTVTVSNAGPASLSVTSAVLTGANANEFEIVTDGCGGTTVAAAGSCTITVRYHPTHSGGAHTARLTIFDDIAPRTGAGTGQDVVLTGSATVPANSPHGEFTPVTPARILDTRNGTGAPLAKIGPGSSIAVQVTGRGGVPSSGVSAVVVNVTAVKPSTNTFITLWPTGTTRPTVSNLNPAAGKAVPNMAIVPLGTDGKISAYNSTGSTDLLFDVVGYYSSYSGVAGSRFHPIEPFRAVDTRNGTGAPKKSIGPGGTLRIDLRGKNGLLPASGMTAVVLNVTAVKPTAKGFITVFPGDVSRPTASNLNTSPGVTAPNLVTVRVPASGIVEFFNSAGNTHLIVDVVGYYDGVRNGDAGRFIPISPTRAWDTREDNDPLAPGNVTAFQIAGFDGVPLTAAAVAANITAVKPTGNGYLTVFPDDVCTIPDVSTLNFAAGQVVPNMAITKLSVAGGCAKGNGWIDVFNPVGYTHVLIDVAGYFT